MAATQSTQKLPINVAARRSRASRLLGTVLVVLALVTGGTTFFVLTGLTPIEPGENVVWAALITNSVLVIGLAALVVAELARLLRARRQRRAGARLHLRVLGLFSIIAVLPAIIVAVIASVTLDRGLDTWFSERTRSIIETSLSVAKSYLREHGQIIRADMLAMATDLNRVENVYETDPDQFRRFFSAQAAIRALQVAMLMRDDLSVIMETETDPDEELLMPPPDAVDRALEGEVVVIAPGASNQVGALVRLPEFDALLYVARSVDPQVINYLRVTQANVAEYSSLEAQRFGVQVAFGLMYVGFALILLLCAVWIGLGFANRLVAPIRRLMGAAEQVAQGNLYVQVPLYRAEGDLATLGATFNKMTTQLRSQRDELLTANDALDERRRFIETVLAGVPAGVLGIGNDGRVTLANRSAAMLLDATQDDLVGHRLDEFAPEIMAVVEQSRNQPSRLIQSQIAFNRRSGERTVTVRVATERGAGPEQGFVVTLDDITELVTAQRTSAWADIARRIAHEIKNPLTPIQLSAERLRRKYGRSITEDREVFDQCTDTIIRQVGDIGRMVDEFSSFARMPKPVIEPANVAETVKQAVFLMRVGNPERRHRARPPVGAGRHPFRPPADLAGGHEHREERRRGHPWPSQGAARGQGADRGFGPYAGWLGCDRRDRQRYRPSVREPSPAARTLHDDAGEGDRPGSGDRRPDHGGARGAD